MLLALCGFWGPQSGLCAWNWTIESSPQPFSDFIHSKWGCWEVEVESSLVGRLCLWKLNIPTLKPCHLRSDYSLLRQCIASTLFPQGPKSPLIDQELLMEFRGNQQTQVQTIDLDKVKNKDGMPWKSCKSMENRKSLPSSIYIQICIALQSTRLHKHPTVTFMCWTAGHISIDLPNKTEKQTFSSFSRQGSWGSR